MEFRLKDLPKVKLPAKLYNLQVFGDVNVKDIKAIEDVLRYQQKKSPQISWFVAVSNTKSDSAVKYYEKTGKRGRPITKVTGKRVKMHVHIGLIGNSEKSAYSIAKNVGKSINKRMGKKVTKVVSMQGAGFIAYSHEQANSFHMGGDFDFRQCKNNFFLEEI